MDLSTYFYLLSHCLWTSLMQTVAMEKTSARRTLMHTSAKG